MKTQKKYTKALREMIGQLHDIIDPDYVSHQAPVHGDIRDSENDNDIKKRLSEPFAKCYIKILGREDILFPICNMQGMEDPMAIQFSLKYVENLLQRGLITHEERLPVMNQLTALLAKYPNDTENDNDDTEEETEE